MVAASYQNLEQISHPYQNNKKWYVQVRLKNGRIKEVRWYDEKSNKTISATHTFNMTKQLATQKEVLGFKNAGYITLVIGNEEGYAPWLKEVGATYTRFWGWSIASDVNIPSYPRGLKFKKLPWELVGNEDGYLKPENQVRAAVDNFLCEDSISQWQGAIGDNIHIIALVKSCNDEINNYGSMMHYHVFIDKNGNEYTWNTAARQLDVGSTYSFDAKVKEYTSYFGTKRTTLNYCKNFCIIQEK